jgi:peptidoglycan/xylan/chitin deacetylase (PgdA/CDA1 family)
MRSLILLIFLVLFPDAKGQNTIFYEIADFYHFKNGAVSLTFDDGSPDQFSTGVKILDQFNYKGTFFIVTSSEDEYWSLLDTMAKNGHEIGSHTVNHPNLKDISIEDAKFELEQSKAVIEKNIKNYQCFSLSYPFGRSNETVREITSQIYQAARSGDYGLNAGNEFYFYQLKTFICGTGTKMKTANQQVNAALVENKWLIESYHGFDGEAYQPVTSDFFTKHLQYIKSKEDYLWIAPFKDVVKYLKERKYTKIELTDSAYNFYSFSIKGSLPDSIYKFPLSLRVKIPRFWGGLKVTQNDIDVPFQIKSDVCDNKYATFDAVPNGGKINIIAGKTGIDTECNHCGFVVFPNPFSQTLTILSNASDKSEFSIYDSKGSCMLMDKINAEIKIINTSDWKSGVYILSIKPAENSKFIIKKIVKE